MNLVDVLDIQACRQFRSVIEECERGEGLCGSILSRSLFETLVAVRFVLAPRVCIVVAPDKNQSPSSPTKYHAKLPPKKHKKANRDWLSRGLRAWLYVAHDHFRDERRARKNLKPGNRVPGLIRQSKKTLKGIEQSQVSLIESRIGPEWTYVIRNEQGYSGLSLRELCFALHRTLYYWYRTIYGEQSRIVHGSDAIRIVGFDDQGEVVMQYASPFDETIAALQSAVQVFLAHMQTIQEFVGFGACIQMGYEGLVDEFQRIYSTTVKQVTL